MRKLIVVLVGLVVLPVAGWAAPTANNQNIGKVGPGKETAFSLSYSGSPTSFTIVSNPAHGTLRRYNPTANPQAYYYKAATNYEGADSFTWKCSDAAGDSGVATCSATISAVPTANDKTSTVVVCGEIMIALSSYDPMRDRDRVFNIFFNPLNGTLESYNIRHGVTNYPTLYYYRSLPGYTKDSFTWYVNNGYYDSNIATYSLNLTPNTAPVASDSSVTLSGGLARYYIGLSLVDPDAAQTLTFTLVSGPSHGSVEIPPAGCGKTVSYTVAKDYVGNDSFTWKCNDGVENSGVATVWVTVSPTQPLPQNQSACAAKNTPLDILASYGGGGGYTYTPVKTSGPSHGNVTVDGTTFRYTPTAGYLGSDSFAWNMAYTGPSTGTTASATCSIVVRGSQTNWPTFRGDAYRTGITPDNPPATLQLQWRRTLPLARQAWLGASYNQIWPGYSNSKYMNIDFNHEPIAADGKVFVGSNRDDDIVAYDAATGAELWRAYADGPIRMAPVYDNGRIYAGSDDSFIYCWNANTGALIWKRRAVPGEGTSKMARKKVFGSLRMISPWCVRGGLLLHSGVLYFASGFWPMEGVFAGALNPENGATLWLDESRSSQNNSWPHRPFVPQGYLVVGDEWGFERNYFLVPNSKMFPERFPLYTGALASGLKSDWAGGLALTSSWPSGSGTPGDKVVPLGLGGFGGATWVVYADNPTTWLKQWPSAITAGSKTYTAADATALGVVGTVWRIMAADGRLLVITAGSVTVNPQLYCFGGDTHPWPPTWPLVVTPLPTTNDVWQTRATRILTDSGVDDRGVAFVLGIGSGRLVDELLLQSSLHVVAVDPDTNKVAALRRKMSDAGLYGTRGSVLVGDPLDSGLPVYMGRLIVAEDVSAAGWTNGVDFVRGVFRSLRPYDGKAWLFTTSGQHTTFSNWVASSCLTNATLTRDSGGEFSVLTRVGALPGAAEWAGTVTHGDNAIHGSIGVLWYGDTTQQFAGGGHYGSSPADLSGGRLVANTGLSVDAYTGIVLSRTQTYSGTKTMAGSVLVQGETVGLQRRNHVFGLRERGFYPTKGGTGCMRSGYVRGSFRIGGAIYSHDIGLVTHPMKVSCDPGNGGGIAANGLVVYAQEEGCECQISPQTSVSFAPDQYAENFGPNAYDEGYISRFSMPMLTTPVMHLGLNFGAPSEHMGPDGKMWFRRLCGNVCPAAYEYADGVRGYYHHSVRLASSEGPRWVAASGILGLTRMRIPLAWPAVAQRTGGVTPVVDGMLSEACWTGTNSTLLSSGAGGVRGETWFRYDAANLYVGAVVRDPGSQSDTENCGWCVLLCDQGKVTSSGFRKALKLYIGRTAAQSGGRLALSTDSYGMQIPYGVESAWSNGGWSVGMVWAGTTNCAVEYGIPWTTLAAEGLDRDRLVVSVSGPKAAGIGHTVPLNYDVVPGLLGGARPYKVRLHFAETEGAVAGQRVFDVKLQGQTVLADFDIFTASGGANRGIVREFTGVAAGNELVVDLIPKVGETQISGVELDAEFELPNQAPVLMTLPVEGDWVTVGGGGRDLRLLSETVDSEGDAMTYTWELDGAPVTSGVYYNQGQWGLGDSIKFDDPYWTLTGRVNSGDRWTQSDVGEHLVKVTANDGRGGVSSRELSVMVTGNNAIPTASAIASPQVADLGTTVSFNASGSSDSDGSIVSYAWDFLDGSTATSATVTHTFAQAGSYNVRLRVTDNSGARRYTSVMVYVMTPDVPHITSALTALAAQGRSFSYTVTASGATPITFGASGLPSGLSLIGAVISGTPTALGTYNVQLTASNAMGTATNTLILRVCSGPTVATAASATPHPVTGTTAALSVLGADDGGESSLTYTWATTGTPPAPVTFNGNGTNTAKNTTASFTKAGSYDLQATISDADGFSVTSSVSVSVSQTMTSVVVTPSSVIVATNATRQFTALATDQFGSALASQPTFAWSVTGGGSIDAGSGLFTAGGVAGGPYTVTASGGGMSGTASVTVAADTTRKMNVSFAGYNRSETLTNFPVLVKFSTTLANGFAYSQLKSPWGYDLRFKDATETQELNYEVESWNTNGESCVWVQVPLLTNNASIWAAWGDANLAASSPVYATNGATWDVNFRGVWHMNQPNALDYTANRYNGTSYNNTNVVSGAVAGAQGFNGTSAYIGLGTGVNPLQGLTSFTLSWWMAQASHQAGGQISSDTGSGANRFICQDYYPDYQPLYANGKVFTGGGATQKVDNIWHYYTLTVGNPAGGTWKFYTDGMQTDSSAWTFTMGSQELQFGKHCTYFFTGRLDEIRAATVARSANWVWAEWLNAASNSVFCELGAVSSGATDADANANGIPDAWEIQNFGSTNALNGGAQDDWDQDGMNNLAEYIAGTCPTNASSVLRVQGSDWRAGTNFVIQWSSETGKWYCIKSSTNLLVGFNEWVKTNIPATPALNTQTVIVDQARSHFYRVTVE